MPKETVWYEDQEGLLAALRAGNRELPSVPVIPGYTELREISRGGQGVVFNAIQQSTRRNVAIKILQHGAWAAPVQRRRFEREIELIAALDHPNVVRLYDSGVTPTGHPYYVMEFVDGIGLDKLVGSGAWATDGLLDPNSETAAVPAPIDEHFAPLLPLPDALALFAKVCAAVHYAHQRGIIHRDLKPSNVRVDADGEPHVLDFGLAKVAGEAPPDASGLRSRTGEFMGSLPWASPEAIAGDPQLADVRSDVYSLGVLLFQLLTGRFPYPIMGPLRTVLDHIQQTPPHRPSTFRRDLNDELDTIVLKCLAKEPERRYQTAGELGRDIRHYLAGEPIDAKRDSLLYTLRKNLRRYRAAAWAAVLVLMLATTTIGLIFALWLSGRQARAHDAEQIAALRAALQEAEGQLTRQAHWLEIVRQTLQGAAGSGGISFEEALRAELGAAGFLGVERQKPETHTPVQTPGSTTAP
ncbi:MAG: protein kinase [Phycisphaerales bacterium]|nr:protein kinase [Phycisphaerales bacterium]